MYLPANDGLTHSLVAVAASIPTVDTHQHLGPEVPVETDLCQMMVDDNYLLTDLVSAGMTEETRERVADPSVPVAERWGLLKPLWERIRHGSYARAHLVALRDLYGADSLRDSQVEEVSVRLSEDFATPGLFRRVLSERCSFGALLYVGYPLPAVFSTQGGIETVLTQGGYFDHQEPRFLNVARPLDRADFSPDGLFEQDAARLGVELKTTDDLVPAMDAILRDHRAKGAVGFKIAALPWTEPTPDELKEAFLRRGQAADCAAAHSLICLYVSRVAALAAEMDVPVAVHTGAPWTNWLDFRMWEPTALIPLLSAFRDTRFDLYHAGIPYVTQASMLGKAFPNVWLNLCWAHVISSELALRSIAEWLDLVPVNKVLAFGGDYHNRTIVLTYGHLTMARSHLAQVLALRIRNGRMSEEDARAVMQRWLCDNPRELYRIAEGGTSADLGLSN